MRAAWQAYEAAQLPLLRMEKPGLKQSQYRDMIWKMVRGRGGAVGVFCFWMGVSGVCWCAWLVCVLACALKALLGRSHLTPLTTTTLGSDNPHSGKRRRKILWCRRRASGEAGPPNASPAPLPCDAPPQPGARTFILLLRVNQTLFLNFGTHGLFHHEGFFTAQLRGVGAEYDDKKKEFIYLFQREGGRGGTWQGEEEGGHAEERRREQQGTMEGVLRELGESYRQDGCCVCVRTGQGRGEAARRRGPPCSPKKFTATNKRAFLVQHPVKEGRLCSSRARG
jgi:hypothetical protein